MPIIGALPVQLLDGTVADAVPVMADFNFIVQQVNANAQPLLTGPTKATLRANFTHNTDAITTGGLFVFGTNTGVTISAVDNTSGQFNPATGVFTPTTSGIYLFTASAIINTTGVTFSGTQQLGIDMPIGSGGDLGAGGNFSASLQANRAYCSAPWLYNITTPNAARMLMTLNFTVGTPVLISAGLTIVGPM